MKNREVAHAFVNEKRAKGSNFYSDSGNLVSYRTKVAQRISPNSIAVTPRKYSQSTSRQMSGLYNALIAAGYEETAERVGLTVLTPGRWNGQGPAWGPEWSTVEFVVWEKIK